MIIKLILENFKRYRGKHEIEFKKGLNLIQGHNDAGKSSLFHAISYAFFNQTPSLGTATYPLVTIGEKRMSVTVEFIDPRTGDLFRLTRYRRASKFTSSGFRLQKYDSSAGWLTLLSSETGSKEKDLRLKLTEILGIDKKLFFNVIYSEQKEFVRLIRGGSDVKRTLDSVIGLSAITSARRCIGEILRSLRVRAQYFTDLESRVNELSEIEARFQNELKKVSEEIITLEDNHKRILKKLKDLEKDKKYLDKVRELLNNIKEIQVELERINARVSHAKEEYEFMLKPWGSLTSLKALLMEAKKELEEYEKEAETLNKKLEEIDNLKSDILRKIGYVEDTLKIRLKVSKRAKCPTCGQPIDPNLIQREIIRLESEYSRLKNELETIVQQRSSIEEKLTQLKRTREEKIKQIQRYSQHLESLQRQLSLIRSLEESKMNLTKRLNASIANFKESLRNYISIYLPQVRLDVDSISDVEEASSLISKIYEELWSEYSKAKALSESTIAKIKSLLNQRKSILTNINDIRKRLEHYKEELQNAKKINKAIEELTHIEKCFEKLENELRKKVLQIIASKTFFWYKQLVSDPLYLSVEIDPETYELKAQPLGFPEAQPVKSFSGGGHETLFALAFRLALAEIIGFNNFLMFDEPTDATDSDNRDTIIEALHRASRRFRQILLITHHGIGKEVSAHIIHVRFDKMKDSSCIETTP